VGDRSAPHLHAALLVFVGLNKAGRISPIYLSDKAERISNPFPTRGSYPQLLGTVLWASDR
jgi:hypothetical protein